MNLYKTANDLKNLSDEQLAQMMQNPGPQAPEYLVLTELSRREKIRQEYGGGEAGPAGGPTIAEEKLATVANGGAAPEPAEAGLGSIAPEQGFSTGGVVDHIRGAADRYGLPYAEFYRAAQLESSLNPRAKNPSSSAGGLFQQIDSNWKEWGRGDRYNPADSADAAARFWASNKKYLESKLGRQLRPGELYLAHQQGPGGALKLLSNPDAPAASVVGSKAVSLNGGKSGMTAGEFAAKWINKAASGNRDPQAANASYGQSAEEPKDNSVGASLLKLVGGASSDEGGIASVFGGGGSEENAAFMKSIASSKAKKDAEHAAGVRAGQQIASADNRASQDELESMFPDTWKAKFADGGEVYAQPDGGFLGWLKKVIASGKDESEIKRPPGYVDPVQAHRSQVETRQSPGGEERVGAGLMAIPGVGEGVKPGTATATTTALPAAGAPMVPEHLTTGDDPRHQPLPPPVVEEPPVEETGSTKDSTMTDTGLGEVLRRLQEGRPDPYAGLKEQIDGMAQKGDPDKQKWRDLARFGFALAATGNVGEAGMAMMSAQDARDEAHNAAVQKQLEMNAKLQEARARAQQGDYDLAARIYLGELGIEADRERTRLTTGKSTGLKPSEQLDWNTAAFEYAEKFYGPDELGAYPVVPGLGVTFDQLSPEQQEQLKEAKRREYMAKTSGALDGNVVGGINDVSDE